MPLIPRPRQIEIANDAIQFFASANPGDKRLYSGPTGSGKTIIEKLILDSLPDALLITPKPEIAWGMIDKGIAPERITTPIKLRNRLLKGELSAPPKLVFDEGHHHNAETWQQIDLLCGMAPAVAFTATPFRGTPKSTTEFRERWGKPHVIMTYKEAIRDGIISFPEITTLPLIDDDEIEIVNGEFQVRRIEAATKSQLGYVADYCYTHHFNAYGKTWYRPTIFNSPSSVFAWEIQSVLAARGMPAGVITDETSYGARQFAFDEAIACRLAIIHINIITEGIDKPFRTMIDMCPVMSPVRFMQTFGRITRPVDHGEAAPQYICTNRNILRHAYLFDGAMPRSAVMEAGEAFKIPSKRNGVRVVGLEGLGRFKATEIPFADKTKGVFYAIRSYDPICGSQEFAAILHPLHPDVMWAQRTNSINEFGETQWGNWQHCAPPDDIQGFASMSANKISDKQLAWWKKQATYYGLDVNVTPTNKQFQVLPIMKDLGIRFNV
jgi:hypothetical protein